MWTAIPAAAQDSASSWVVLHAGDTIHAQRMRDLWGSFRGGRLIVRDLEGQRHVVWHEDWNWAMRRGRLMKTIRLYRNPGNRGYAVLDVVVRGPHLWIFQTRDDGGPNYFLFVRGGELIPMDRRIHYEPLREALRMCDALHPWPGIESRRMRDLIPLAEAYNRMCGDVVDRRF